MCVYGALYMAFVFMSVVVIVWGSVGMFVAAVVKDNVF